jgi:hypothetical protein
MTGLVEMGDCLFQVCDPIMIGLDMRSLLVSQLPACLQLILKPFDEIDLAPKLLPEC